MGGVSGCHHPASRCFSLLRRSRRVALPSHSPLCPCSDRRPPLPSVSASPRRQMLGKLFKVKKLELMLVGIENSGKLSQDLRG